MSTVFNRHGRYFIRVFDDEGNEKSYRSNTRNMKWHFQENGFPRLILCFKANGRELLCVFKRYEGFESGFYVPIHAYEKGERDERSENGSFERQEGLSEYGCENEEN